MRRRWVPVILLPAALAAVLATLRISDQPLDIDEEFSRTFSRQPFRDLLQSMFDSEANMGPYYLALHGWQYISESTEWLRMLSVLGGLVAVVLVTELGRRWWDLRTGLLAGTLLAVHPFALVFLTEARAYSWAVAMALVSTLAIDPERRTVNPIVYGLGAGIGTALNLVNGLLVVAHLLAFLVVKAPRRTWHSLLQGFALAAAIFAPFVPAYLYRSGTQTPWINELSAIRVAASLKDILGGYMLAVVLGAGLAAFYLLALRREQLRTDPKLALIAAPLPVGVVLLAALSLVQPLFVPRYLIFVLPFVVVALATVVGKFDGSRRYGLAAVLLVLLVVVQGWPIDEQPQRRSQPVGAEVVVAP